MRGNATLRRRTVGATGSTSLGRTGAAIRRGLADRFENRPERVPLVWTLPNEGLEAMHDPLHQVLLGLAIGPREGGLEADVVPAGRSHVLVSGYKGRTGLQRQRGRSAGDEGAMPEEADLHARPFFLVAHQAHHAVGIEGLNDLPHRRSADLEHLQAVALARLHDRAVEGAREAPGHGRDGIAEGTSVRAGVVPGAHVR